MGIQGLLPQLKPIQNPVSLYRYEGQTLGIDGYAWLHRAACCCAYELVTGKPTTKYLQFFIKKISMLKSFQIEPYLIFDGDAIAVKKDTELKRRDKRAENKRIAERLLEVGEKNNAMDYFQKCVDVTPEMAKCVIDYCKVNRIQYIVAPFEADAQMVYLEKQRLIQGIISEDSDLLIFGCRKLITKLNDFGECIEICRDDFDKLPKKFPLNQLTDDEMRTMVCLSGCDYTSGIPKVGLITAMKLVQRFRTLERILLNIQRDGKLKIPTDFAQEVRLANFAFQYQRVFCPLTNRMVTLNDIPNDLLRCQELYESIGYVIHKDTESKRCVMDNNEIHHDLHFQIAVGALHPTDFHRRLINREQKLQLSSKSEMQSTINEKSLQRKQIDSFFKKVENIASQRKNIVPKISIVDKIEETIKRRRLNHGDEQTTAKIGLTTSKFFQATQEDEDDIETEVPESQLPTQISSLSPTQVDNYEEDDEVLSEVDIDKDSSHDRTRDQSPSSTFSSASCEMPDRITQQCALLQKYRYSDSREPLKSKNLNKVGRILHVTAQPKEQQLNRNTSTDRSVQNTRRIIVRARSTTAQEVVPRPALRSLSLSSRFAYSASATNDRRL